MAAKKQRKPRSPGQRKLAAPVYAQPEPTADPTIFKIKHPSDADAYKEIDTLARAGRRRRTR